MLYSRRNPEEVHVGPRGKDPGRWSGFVSGRNRSKQLIVAARRFLPSRTAGRLLILITASATDCSLIELGGVYTAQPVVELAVEPVVSCTDTRPTNCWLFNPLDECLHDDTAGCTTNVSRVV